MGKIMTLLQDATGISDTTLRSITRIASPTRIAAIHASFIDFCQDNAVKYDNWVDAWNDFWTGFLEESRYVLCEEDRSSYAELFSELLLNKEIPLESRLLNV